MTCAQKHSNTTAHQYIETQVLARKVCTREEKKLLWNIEKHTRSLAQSEENHSRSRKQKRIDRDYSERDLCVR
jgi:hypothetical protein